MTEDIHDIVNRLAQELDGDRRKAMIENYINQVASRVQLSAAVDLAIISPDSQIKDEIETWKSHNRDIFAYKVSEVARIILQQELLGE